MGLRVLIFNQEAHIQQKRILPKKLYHACSIDETNYSEIVCIRKEKLDKATLLFAEGCSEGVVFEALNISRSSYYRWKRSYEKFGLEGLEHESRRPHCVRKETWTSQVEMNIYHQKRLQKFAHFYNCVRPHEGIGLLTPRRFYEVISYKMAQSHMS